jgi:hypothetical protein
MEEWRYTSTSALDGGEWLHSLDALLARKRAPPGTHSIGGFVYKRAGLDTVKKTKSHAPIRNPTPAVQPMAGHFTELKTQPLSSIHKYKEF